jgi:hypothetical protein
MRFLNGEEVRFSNEDYRIMAEECAKDLAVIASDANMTVQELFDGLDKSLKVLNEKDRERDEKRLEVEFPT